MEKETSQNFATPKALDSLSIAGLSVWAICSTIGTVSDQIDSFVIRILAISISMLWSLSLFVKNKRWNKSYNYILILVNGALIYINAAGINTVTRQSPFEGYGVKTTNHEIHSEVIKSSIFDFTAQKDWYPDYELIKYADSLKEQLYLEKSSVYQLSNQFSFVRDKVYSLSFDSKTKQTILTYIGDYGKPIIDSNDLRMNNYLLKTRIDSLENALKNMDEITRTTTISTYYNYEGKKVTAEEMVNIYYKTIVDNELRIYRLENLLNFLNENRNTPRSVIDSLIMQSN